MTPPAPLPGQAEAAPAELALTLAAGGSPAIPPEPEGISLNPLGVWALLAAWTILIAVQVWTWRLLLRRRRDRQEAA